MGGGGRGGRFTCESRGVCRVRRNENLFMLEGFS
jgi:hypothetical protein